MRISFNSPTTLLFVAICGAELFASTMTNGAIRPYFVSPSHFDPLSLASWTGSVLYIFGHYDQNHFLGNMTYILLLGPIAEEKYGSEMLAVLMLITAILTSVANASIFGGSILGASGIVFMLITLSSCSNMKTGAVPITLILVAFIFIGKEVLASTTHDGISHFAHIFGGIFGGMFGLMFPKK